jgi:hypothetical protein
MNEGGGMGDTDTAAATLATGNGNGNGNGNDASDLDPDSDPALTLALSPRCRPMLLYRAFIEVREGTVYNCNCIRPHRTAYTQLQPHIHNCSLLVEHKITCKYIL